MNDVTDEALNSLERELKRSARDIAITWCIVGWLAGFLVATALWWVL